MTDYDLAKISETDSPRDTAVSELLERRRKAAGVFSSTYVDTSTPIATAAPATPLDQIRFHAGMPSVVRHRAKKRFIFAAFPCGSTF